MTMEGDAVGSFEDWELLANSDSDLVNSPISMANSSISFEEIMADRKYVQVNRYIKTTLDSTDEGSIESDNPSWINPNSKTRFQSRNSSDQCIVDLSMEMLVVDFLKVLVIKFIGL
ncbi:hypothetical protein DKX38_026047 [Salix brachista]|uniref:Uncharacterized protein n=1 Tax=Salix brachista TaxID=2182728 RepID=A0A5N5JQN4_9ROSI|nr:hypothetical protein DKX38_026047 [Salix brachista]